MRRALPLVAAMAAIGVVAGCGGDDGDSAGAEAAPAAETTAAAAKPSGTLTFVDYGGEWQDAETKAWLDPFASANPDLKLRQVTTYDPAKLKAMVESGNVTWDVADTAKSDPFDSAETLTKIDCKIVACDQFPPEAKFDGYRAPFYSFATILGYNTEKVGENVPQNWADFFDTKKVPGKRAIYVVPNAGSIESALLADGVAPDQLYPLDIDRALRKFETIRKDIIWYETGAQCADMVASGEVAMGQCWNGRMVAPLKAGKPVATQWNQCLPFYGALGIPKGSKNVNAAMHLIAYITAAENNAAATKYFPNAPTNPGSTEFIAPEFKDHLVTAHADKCAPTDEDQLGKNGAEIQAKLQEWMTK